ncbi:unnamed protein product [Linum trigynum]|uniref:Uncharacterized protein n=1 Tax=Linum trigynum TaxID=586398 RepID=A0AAV2E8B2_9ROSI
MGDGDAWGRGCLGSSGMPKVADAWGRRSHRGWEMAMPGVADAWGRRGWEMAMSERNRRGDAQCPVVEEGGEGRQNHRGGWLGFGWRRAGREGQNRRIGNWER